MCTIYKKKVKWTLDTEFLYKIKNSIMTSKYEVAGKLLFSDTRECKNGVCNKISSKFTLINGDSNSVMTPRGIINYHTHPIVAYKSEDAVFGWPSGEDMGQSINFAKSHTLVHIVFTLEGAYIIHIKKPLDNTTTKLVERLFKMTHGFRSSDQKIQFKKFKEFLNQLDFQSNKKNTVGLWLDLANNITTNELYRIFNKKLKGDNDYIFDVQLIKITNKPLSFEAYYIEETCHLKSFGKSHH